MHIGVSTGARGSQKRVSNPLLELQVIVSHPMGESIGKQIWSLYQSSYCDCCFETGFL